MKGDVKALPLFSSFLSFTQNTPVCIALSDGSRETRVLSRIKKHNKYIIISFEDVHDPETAAKLRDSVLLIERRMLPVPDEGTFFYDQIIGLDVFTVEGVFLGKVHDIIETGSNDVYIVKNNEKECLIPAIRDVIKEIDIEGKKIVISVMEGLLD